jgi:putative methyltransferase (TIGR04325 family)
MSAKTRKSRPLPEIIADGVLNSLRRIRRMIVPELLEYAPQGWRTTLQEGEQGWLADSVVAEQREEWARFSELLRRKGPLGFSPDAPSLDDVANVSFHNINYTYGYVLTRTAFGRERLSVLDWGGGLGHYYLLAKALLPQEVLLNYHCKDVRSLVELGRELAPAITWHQDDSCLDLEYDLVMVSGSLQYCQDWKDLLGKIRKASKRYFYLTRTPVVQVAPSFVAIQRAYGTRMLHLQFNEKELLAEVDKLGFTLVREIALGDRVYIKNAPEDAVLKGWLFTV